MIPPAMPEDGDSFGGRLRAARRRLRTAGGRRWGQGDLAAAIGVERNTVSRWENGNIRPRDPAMIATLAQVLNVSASWLLDGFGPAGGAPPGGRAELRDGASGVGPYMPAPSAGRADGRDLSTPVRTLITRYLDRLTSAGCTPPQVAGAEVLLVAGARNDVAVLPFAARSDADISADVDAAWDCVVQILRREGIRP